MINKPNDKEAEQVFRVVVQPISEHVTTDNMIRKLSLLFGGIGLKVVEAEPMTGRTDKSCS